MDTLGLPGCGRTLRWEKKHRQLGGSFNQGNLLVFPFKLVLPQSEHAATVVH